MKHAKPNPNKRRAAVVLALGSTGALPLIGISTAHASPGDTTTTNDNGTLKAVTTPDPAVCEDYIVKPGDTFSGIAAKLGVSLSALEPQNPGVIAGDRPDDYSLLFAGGHVHNCGTVPVAPPKVMKHARHHHVRTHVWYRDCEAAPAGLHRGQPGYRHALDMDGDGIACEGPWPPVVVTPPPPPVTPPPVDNPPPVVIPSGTTPVIAPDCPGTPSGYCSHPVSYWAPLIEQAMVLAGGNVAANHDVAGVEALMSAESSGNPNAINNSDINAQNGTPSKGLMQVIQPTFDTYHVAGTSTNLYDPLANIAAALAYINDQYGGNIPGSPY